MNTTSYLKRKSKVIDLTMTPPMASRSRSRSSSVSSVDDSDEESYFSKTYIPLSSLPTPPLSSHSNMSTRQTTPESFSIPGEIMDPDLLGPAIHLTNLIPSSTSLTISSVPLVHAMLTRALLPLETIALAVCILDSLNSRFALSFRKDCPLLSPTSKPPSSGPQHVDSIHPELIVLAALTLAVKFLVDDEMMMTKDYRDEWGRGMWSCEQINFTQRCVLDNLGYRLLPLWEDRIILEALEDMERAGRQANPVVVGEEWKGNSTFGGFLRVETAMSRGTAVMGVGEQMTPVETPLVENVRGTKDLSPETKTAFQSSDDTFPELPLRTKGPFSRVLDPSVESMGFGL